MPQPPRGGGRIGSRQKRFDCLRLLFCLLNELPRGCVLRPNTAFVQLDLLPDLLSQED